VYLAVFPPVTQMEPLKTHEACANIIENGKHKY
jgi:hypothetical protein